MMPPQRETTIQTPPIRDGHDDIWDFRFGAWRQPTPVRGGHDEILVAASVVPHVPAVPTGNGHLTIRLLRLFSEFPVLRPFFARRPRSPIAGQPVGAELPSQTIRRLVRLVTISPEGLPWSWRASVRRRLTPRVENRSRSC